MLDEERMTPGQKWESTRR